MNADDDWTFGHAPALQAKAVSVYGRACRAGCPNDVATAIARNPSAILPGNYRRALREAARVYMLCDERDLTHLAAGFIAAGASPTDVAARLDQLNSTERS